MDTIPELSSRRCVWVMALFACRSCCSLYPCRPHWSPSLGQAIHALTIAPLPHPCHLLCVRPPASCPCSPPGAIAGNSQHEKVPLLQSLSPFDCSESDPPHIQNLVTGRCGRPESFFRDLLAYLIVSFPLLHSPLRILPFCGSRGVFRVTWSGLARIMDQCAEGHSGFAKCVVEISHPR